MHHYSQKELAEHRKEHKMSPFSFKRLYGGMMVVTTFAVVAGFLALIYLVRMIGSLTVLLWFNNLFADASSGSW
jgi:hypothetical protein